MHVPEPAVRISASVAFASDVRPSYVYGFLPVMPPNEPTYASKYPSSVAVQSSDVGVVAHVGLASDRIDRRQSSGSRAHV